MMGVCWMLVILLCCVSSHATEHPYTNASFEQLKFHCVPEQSYVLVFVPCPNVTADKKNYMLYKEQTMIHSCSLNKEIKTCKAVNGSKLNIQLDHKDKSTGFTANVTGEAMYTCRVKTLFPPPSKSIPSEKMVTVLIKGRSCQYNTISCKPLEEKPPTFLWIWITVVALLCTYSLAATVVAVIIWFKLQNAETQSDYINTKPVAHRQRKNRNKVQNPIPRYV